MRKLVFGLLTLLSVFAFTGQVHAASQLYAKISAPQSPSNRTDLSINVVVLDQNQVPSISVQCYWRKNGGSWNTLGAVINVIPGGNNTANCKTSSSEVNEDATYDFYAHVSGSESMDTQTVGVTVNTSKPGTPTNYSKEKPTSCTYKISFKTADDAGKTVKVEIYRSTNTSFTADNGTKVGQVAIGSNTDGFYNDNVPDCGTNYYYAIRAFDAAGNGSDVVGDSQTVTILPTTTGASGAAGAIPAGTGGNILGAEASEGPTGPSGAILGDEASEAASPTPEAYTPPTPNVFNVRNVSIGVGAFMVILLALWLRNRKNNPET